LLIVKISRDRFSVTIENRIPGTAPCPYHLARTA